MDERSCFSQGAGVAGLRGVRDPTKGGTVCDVVSSSRFGGEVPLVQGWAS